MPRGKDAVLTAPLMGHTLIEEQAALEQQSIIDGVARYRQLANDAIRRGEGDKLKPVERMLTHWFDAVSIFIGDEIAACRRSEPGIGRAIHGPVLRAIGPDGAAVCVMQEVANACLRESGGTPTTNVAYKVGRAVLAEIEAGLLKSRDPEAYRELFSKHRKTSDRKVRAAWGALNRTETPKRRVCIIVGGCLIGILLRAATVADYDEKFEPAFEEYMVVKMQRGHRHSTAMLRMTEAALDIIDHGHARREILRPRYLPMIVRPYRWSEDAQGGYIRIRTPLISKPRPEQKDAIAKADMTRIYLALDALASAPVRVDPRISALQRELWDGGGGELRIPSRKNFEMDRPFPEGGTDEQIKAWKVDAIQMHRANAQLRSEREDYIRLNWMTGEFSGRDPIFLPHMMDFRGRVFPIPTHLNHHGDDAARGLLEFSEPKDANDADSQYWIRVHAANCYGFDKVSFDEQAEWVGGHTAEIARSVAEPMSFDWWKRADKPWQFLQACFALTDPEAAARLPVQRDGTCNGMQHYVALSRDERGAPFVNLTESDRPGDLYSAVLEAVERAVQRDARAGHTHARAVLPLLGRKVVKQTVMTVVYGVTRHGASEQVRERLKELGLEGQPLYRAAGYLSGVVLDSIGEVCEAASSAMDWLVECARIITDSKQPVAWTSPIGLPVVQPYRKERPYYVATRLRSMRIRHAGIDAPIRKKKHLDGVAPNYIHSVDASHLMMTAIECAERGLALQTVHDAYRTHAADIGTLDCVIREKFIELHAEPLLPKLAAEWAERYPDLDLPEPPATGSLDIESVRDSLYFFS